MGGNCYALAQYYIFTLFFFFHNCVNVSNNLSLQQVYHISPSLSHTKLELLKIVFPNPVPGGT